LSQDKYACSTNLQIDESIEPGESLHIESLLAMIAAEIVCYAKDIQRLKKGEAC
jgi:hypothetical protein